MRLTGTHTINALPSTVFEMLMNTDTLTRIVPGVSRLEKISDNKFRSILTIKLGPVNTSFTGELQLQDITAEKGFTLKVQQNSKIGNANAAVKILLLAVNQDQTEISFDGDVKLSGTLAGMGQRLIGSISNTLTKQFFSNLEKEILLPVKEEFTV